MIDLRASKIPYNTISIILAFIDLDYKIYKRDIKNNLLIKINNHN